MGIKDPKDSWVTLQEDIPEIRAASIRHGKIRYVGGGWSFSEMHIDETLHVEKGTLPGGRVHAKYVIIGNPAETKKENVGSMLEGEIVFADEVIIADKGIFSGKITAQKVTLETGATLKGELCTHQFLAAPGSTFKGSFDKSPKPLIRAVRGGQEAAGNPVQPAKEKA